MGNKRVGLLRTKALFENLKRELNMNGSRALNTHKKIITVNDTVPDPTEDATVALKMSDSGALVVLNAEADGDQWQSVSIPLARPASVGWWCDIAINHPVEEYEGGVLVYSGPGLEDPLSVQCRVIGNVLCGTPIAPIAPPIVGITKVAYVPEETSYAIILMAMAEEGNSFGGGFLRVEIIANNLWKAEGTLVCGVGAAAAPMEPPFLVPA